MLLNILLQGFASGADWEQFLYWQDFVLFPIYFIIILLVFLSKSKKKYPIGHPWRKHYKRAFLIKLSASILIGLIYQYYYRGGDTSAYFYHAQVINSALLDSPVKWINLILHNVDSTDGAYLDYMARMMWYDSPSEYFVCSITAVFALIGLNSYLPTSLLFAAFFFSGSWALFRTFAQDKPNLTRYIAFATLYIPSVVMWGSGIFKDTICLFALGWMTYTAVQLFVKRKFNIKYFVLFGVSFYLVAQIKVYILVAFAPALMVWIFSLISAKFKSIFARIILNIFFAGAVILIFAYAIQVFAEELGKYSLENVASTAQIQSEYLKYVSDKSNAASYDLGAFDPTPTGMSSKFFPAVNVTLFRPYLWEAKSLMVMINALEAFLFLLLTVRVLFSVGPFSFFTTILKDPNLRFFLVFVLIFAFAVGLTSVNFGALSRYRIPCLPFYMLFLIFIFYQKNPPSKKIFGFY